MKNQLTVKQRLLSATCLVGAIPFLAASAYAQDITIDTPETLPTITSDRLGVDPATLIIAPTGGVSLADGTPLVINGPHNLLLQGPLLTSGLSNQTGIRVDSSDLSLSGALDIFNTITVSENINDDMLSRTNNIGILFTGQGGFTGSLNLSAGVAAVGEQAALPAASLIIGGDNASGVVIDTSFTGDINFGGSIQLEGVNGTGFLLGAPIVGDISLRGTIVASGAGSSGLLVSDSIDGSLIINSNIDVGALSNISAALGTFIPSATPEGAIIINSSITNGVLLDGVGVNNQIDTDDIEGVDFPPLDRLIRTLGGGTAIRVENTALDGRDLRLGPVIDNDGSDLGYGFVVRNNVQSLGDSAGISATGLSFGSVSGAGATIIDGGILFEAGALTVSAVDATATGLVFKAGANVERVDFLSGQIGVLTTESVTIVDSVGTVGPGGDAIGILIEEGALVPVINHRAISILSSANGDGANAIAIQDLSGNLERLSISGEDIAIGNTSVRVGNLSAFHTGENPGEVLALDVRANTSGFDLFSSGTVTGGIVLGSGNDTVTFDGIEQQRSGLQTGGFLIGDIDFGTGADRITLLNNAQIIGGLSFGGTLDLQVADSTLTVTPENSLLVNSATFSGVTTLNPFLNPISGDGGVLTVTNDLTLNGALSITPNFQTFTLTAREFVIVDAGTLTSPLGTKELNTANNLALFDISLEERTESGRDQIVLRVDPLSATELGLNAQQDEFYQALQTSLDPDIQLASTIANLPTIAAVSQAFTGLTPDSSNRVFELALSNQRIINRNFSERLDDFIHNRANPTGAWAVEHAALGRFETANDLLNENYQNFGLSVGYTGKVTNSLAIGVGAGFSLIGSSTNGEIGTNIAVFAPYVTGYALYKKGDFYAGATGSTILLDIERTRSLNFIDLQRIIQSESSGVNFSGSFETGYALEIGKFTLKPFGRLSANALRENDFNETGGSSLSSFIESRSMNRIDGRVGANASYEFVWSRNVDGDSTVRPEIFVALDRYVAGDLNADLVGQFSQNNGSTFRLTGQEISRNGTVAGVQLSIFGNSSTARIRYTYEDRETFIAHSATFNFRLSF